MLNNNPTFQKRSSVLSLLPTTQCSAAFFFSFNSMKSLMLNASFFFFFYCSNFFPISDYEDCSLYAAIQLSLYNIILLKLQSLKSYSFILYLFLLLLLLLFLLFLFLLLLLLKMSETPILSLLFANSKKKFAFVSCNLLCN